MRIRGKGLGTAVGTAVDRMNEGSVRGKCVEKGALAGWALRRIDWCFDVSVMEE